MAYIDLNRSFALIPKDHEFGDDGVNPYFSRTKTVWTDILKLNRVVILAEAGSGKTEEISATTRRLRADGKRAFFFRLELLSGDFDTSFEEGNLAEFEEWFSSDEEAWFFLDSVDEVRLQGPAQFEQAIRKFAGQLGGHKQRARIFITSRPSAWRANTDLGFIRNNLPYYEPREREECENQMSAPANGTNTYSADINHDKGESPIEPSVYVLQSLENEQKKIFSEAYGVSNSSGFIEAIEKAEADIFSDTPQDLIELIDYWNANGTISNRAEMIEFGIRKKLEEAGDRAEALPLSEADALAGAKRLAAATTFTRKNRILVPDQGHDQTVKSESIDAKCVLNDWNDNKCRALLLRPIFDVAIYGTVRFHHRSVREYLTARWLHDLLQSGKLCRSIEALFFAERYGEQVTVPSLRPILAWLVLWNDRIRQRTVETSPEVMIQGGDPSALPTNVRANFLQEFCRHYANQQSRYLSFDISELRRFSHPDLAHSINELMEEYSSNDDIAELLLRMVWQGDISGCSGLALMNAVDPKASTYRRIAAIRSIVSIGTADQKKQLVSSILSERALEHEDILGEIIAGFAPEYLHIDGLITLMARIRNRDRFSTSSLSHYLKQFIQHQCPAESLIDFICGVLGLLKQEPVVEKRFFEVSQDYQWALSFAAIAAERLVKEKPDKALKPEALEVISLAQASRYFDTYRPTDLDLSKLVSGNTYLNLALFWVDVELSRKKMDKKNEQRLTEWHQAISMDHFWQFGSDDFDNVLEDVRSKYLLDDRLVALSLAFNIYANNGRGDKRRRAMWRAVKGNEKLEEKLRSLLNPPTMDKEQRKWRREEEGWKLKEKERKRREEENRKNWINWLKDHTDVLRDASIASKGSVWNASDYLLSVLQEKCADRGHWAQPHWETLIKEFGLEVAEAFRDGCIAYWREYVPEVRSEGIDNPNSTPHAVVIGLSGLEMEANLSGNWPNGLSKKDAELASRYAVRELNGFPDWLQNFHQYFPDALEGRLMKEIEWELAEYEGEQPSHYVLSDASRLEWLRPKLAGRVFEILQVHEPKHFQSAEDALSIVLSADNLDVDTFVDLAKIKVGSLEELSRLGLWLAAWVSVQAAQGIDALTNRLAEFVDREQATNLAMCFITSLLGSRRISPVGSVHRRYRSVEHLHRLILLMNQYIHHSDDIDRTKGYAYSPSLRDNAQDARNHLFQLLKEIPGKETYLAMLDLSQTHPDEQSRDWYRIHAKQHAEADAEQEAWCVKDIVEFSEEAEKSPQTHRELFELAVLRLNDLKDNLEAGDSSNAGLLAGAKEEKKHRIYIGDWLREHSRGHYAIPQEEEMADAKKPDLRFHQQTIDAPVPIELKVADNWSTNALLERLENQLCGQYLRDARSNCGIFLLTRCGKKRWKLPESNELIGFPNLLSLLEAKAEDILQISSKIKSIAVIGIDLTKRGQKVEVGKDI